MADCVENRSEKRGLLGVVLDQVARLAAISAATVSPPLPVVDAAAQTSTPVSTPSDTSTTPHQPEATVDRATYWSLGEARPFAAGKATAGPGYGRLALAAGYGRPHWIWAGVETSGYLSPYFGCMQAGLHASGAVVDVSASFRRTGSFEFGLIAPVPSVTRAELTRNNDKARYDSLDASVWGFVPYQRLLLGWEFTYVRPFNLGDALLFEEVQRVVVGRDGVFTTKLSPMLELLTDASLYVGLMGEQLSLLGRTRTMVLRLGPSTWARLGDHWSLFGSLTFPVQSPDRLGAWNASYGYIGLTYAFATGEE